MTRERAEWELFGTDFNDTFDQKVDEHKSLESAGILPTPKAGAPAPPKPGAPGDDPADDESADDATPPANQGPKK
jgi:hypothetical protein